MGTSREGGRTIDPQLVEYLVVVVPDGARLNVVLDAVETAVDRDHTVVLDIAVVARDRTGEVGVAEIPDRAHRSWLHDAGLGVLSEGDLRLIGEAVEPGSLGVVVVVEDLWARPIADAARAVGGHVAGGERVPSARLEALLPELQIRRRPEP